MYEEENNRMHEEENKQLIYNLHEIEAFIWFMGDVFLVSFGLLYLIERRAELGEVFSGSNLYVTLGYAAFSVLCFFASVMLGRQKKIGLILRGIVLALMYPIYYLFPYALIATISLAFDILSLGMAHSEFTSLIWWSLYLAAPFWLIHTAYVILSGVYYHGRRNQFQ